MSMQKYLASIVLLYASLGYTGTVKTVWNHATLSEKILMIDAAKGILFKNPDVSGDWIDKKTTYFRLIDEAYAAQMDCIYAGWPSLRVNKLCSSPARHNPDYASGSCTSGQMQCQPLLFGPDLCVSMLTQNQRSSAFSNCNQQFIATGRTVESVFQEVLRQDKEEQLVDLIEYAGKICTESKQAQSGMCRRLEQVVGGLQKVMKQNSVPKSVAESEGLLLKVVNETVKMEEIVKSATALPTKCLPPIEAKIEVPLEKELSNGLVEESKTYSPGNALADINNGELVFLGRDLFYGFDSNRTCVFKSKTAYVLNHHCMSSRKEISATDLEVISFKGGKTHFYIENGITDKKISTQRREEYDGTWNLDFTKFAPPGPDLNMAELKSYYQQQSESYPGGYFVGNSPGTRPTTAVATAFSGGEDLLPEGKKAEEFWKNPPESWYDTLKMLRKQVETVKF